MTEQNVASVVHRERLESRADAKEWERLCPLTAAAREAAGQGEYERQQQEREEIRRARDFQDAHEAAYGRRPSIAEARMAVIHGADGGPKINHQAVIGSPTTSTAEVAAQLRGRNFGLRNIRVGPEQPDQWSSSNDVAAVSWGPDMKPGAVPGMAYASEALAARQRQIGGVPEA
jgi:hypothetical protein